MAKAFTPTEKTRAKYEAFLSAQSPVVLAIAVELRRGKKMSDAMDFVCGEGSYAKFAREIYDAARANQ